MANEKQALGMTMQINQEFIENIARDLVSESLLKTLGGGDKFVETLIREILTTKVDRKDGRVSTWSDAIPYVNYLINKILREEITGTVAQIMDEKRPEIRKVIRKELMKADTVDRFYKAFTDSVIAGMDESWRCDINVSFGEVKRD